MAVTPNQPNNPKLTPQEQELREQVDLIDRQALGWKNILSLKLQISKASREEESVRKQLLKLQKDEAKNAAEYKKSANAIKQFEKDLQEEKLKGNKAGVRGLQNAIQQEKELQKQLGKTTGGALMMYKMRAKATKDTLTAEKQLIKDINKERGIGGRLADLFRTKEERQRQIDLARARVGGGANLPSGGGRGRGVAAGAAGDGMNAALAGAGTAGLLIAAVGAAVEKLKAPFVALGNTIKNSLTAPLAQISGLVSGGIGGGYGVGGGAISGAGATSILGGIQDIASKIPFIGGLLGGLIGAFKAVADLVLGLDQGLTNFARNLGISKDRAKGIKEEFRALAKSSDNIIVNETRLMESQAELTKALGVRNQFSNSILENNVKLKEVAGLELETRKALAQTSVIQNRNAEGLTKSILAQSKAFEFETGIAFEFRDVLNQAGKLAGALGLSFTKYPEKLTKSLMVTKAMGFELKQLDSLASSFLDFESSISKEMEAQVLTGRDMNLTLAREAALNNDYATLSQEITKNVGTTAEFLNMNRIQQDAIAESVGMTRDGLADVLRQQDYYRKLGATNLKQAQEELKILKQKGLTQAEISKQIGEDAYNYITQTSTAERLTELMNKIKTTFIEFVEKSGILDFITNPQKVEGFVKGLIGRLAGAVELVGDIIAGILEALGSIVGIFNERKGANLQSLANTVRSGAGEFAGGIRSMTSAVGGTPAESIGETVVAGTKATATAAAGVAASGAGKPADQYITVYTVIDGEVVAKKVVANTPNLYQKNTN